MVSAEALAWIREKLHTYLEQQLTNQQLRQLIAYETSNTTRTWKVTRQADAVPLSKTRWSMTIIDLVPSVQDAEEYCEQVRQWARTTLEQMQSAHSCTSVNERMCSQ